MAREITQNYVEKCQFCYATSITFGLKSERSRFRGFRFKSVRSLGRNARVELFSKCSRTYSGKSSAKFFFDVNNNCCWPLLDLERGDLYNDPEQWFPIRFKARTPSARKNHSRTLAQIEI